MCFLSRLGIRSGGVPKGWVHNLLMQLLTLDSPKIELLKTFFLTL